MINAISPSLTVSHATRQVLNVIPVKANIEFLTISKILACVIVSTMKTKMSVNSATRTKSAKYAKTPLSVINVTLKTIGKKSQSMALVLVNKDSSTQMFPVFNVQF